MNALREAIKEQQAQSLLQMERDSALYDELSRLNNELANMQRELAKKNAELEQLNQEKNRFLGMAAHDLRTPLGIVLTYSEFLADEVGQELAEEQQEFLTVIRQSSEFMLKLVDDLLDISNIEAGRLSLDLQPADLAALVERSVALNNVLSAKKSVIISFESAGDLPKVVLDAAKFEQVLNNLLSNAVKFSPPGAHVRVRLARRGDEVVLSVADQGPGIPAAELDRLFKPFVRGKARGTAGEKSTGLGLTIARRVVEGHGGRIWAESEEGRGSTFYVALPLHHSSDN
jgi:signal transduction histidine kinase